MDSFSHNQIDSLPKKFPKTNLDPNNSFEKVVEFTKKYNFINRELKGKIFFFFKDIDDSNYFKDPYHLLVFKNFVNNLSSNNFEDEKCLKKILGIIDKLKYCKNCEVIEDGFKYDFFCNECHENF